MPPGRLGEVVNVRKVVAVSAVWFVKWVLDIVLVFVQLAGAFVAAIGGTRLYYDMRHAGVAGTSIAADYSIGPAQGFFYFGAIVLGLATWARWELKK